MAEKRAVKNKAMNKKRAIKKKQTMDKKRAVDKKKATNKKSRQQDNLQKNNLVWMVGGEAGYGIMAAGLIFAKTFSRGNLNVFANNEYPSLIRGGHNTFTVRVSDKPIHSCISKIDLLVALNKETIELHKDELSENSAIIYDSSIKSINAKNINVNKGIRLCPVPLERFAQELGEKKIMMNSVAIGASLALVNYDFNIFASVIKDIFGEKGPRIVDTNLRAAKEGYNYVKKNHKEFGFELKPVRAAKKMVMTGNDAIALGAVNAGCKFISAYPMTPASAILHNLSAWAKDANLITVQPEDELAAINMAIGAGYAGVRSMTATSGGGFCLMVEGLGLAGISETPVVIVEGQRPGPSTGMPTRTEQGDLRFPIHASQGEFPRIILAPGDVEDCFYLTQEAFNLAERFQCPVILMADKYLMESYKTAEGFDLKKIKLNRGSIVSEKQLKPLKLKEFFPRYKFTPIGVSPRTLPGMKNGIFISTSEEHDEFGQVTDDPANRIRMMDKRMEKMEQAKRAVPRPVLYGTKKAKITILSWGSPKGSILEAIELLKKDGINTNFMQLTCLHPFPANEVAGIISSASQVIVVEQNKTSQLSSLIREHTGDEIRYRILKYDGKPFPVDYLYAQLKKVIK